MIYIEELELSRVPSEVLSLTTPGVGSMMKKWVSDAKQGDTDGYAWLAREGKKLVGWAAVVDGEISIYVKPSERRRGIGTILIQSMGDTDMLSAKPHNRIGEKFFQKNDVTY